MSTLESRIREVMATPGWTSPTEVAKAAGVSRSAVAQWLGQGSKRINSINLKAAMSLQRVTQFSAEWIATGSGPRAAPAQEQSPQWMSPANAGVAHAQDVREFTLPPVVTREQLMDPRFELPAVFEVSMPDDAMAPEIPAGRQLIFERTSTMPRPGTRILIADGSGRRHVRRFAEGRDGAWRALPDNRSHMDLDSRQDKLQLLAVLRWVGAE